MFDGVLRLEEYTSYTSGTLSGKTIYVVTENGEKAVIKYSSDVLTRELTKGSFTPSDKPIEQSYSIKDGILQISKDGEIKGYVTLIKAIGDDDYGEAEFTDVYGKTQRRFIFSDLTKIKSVLATKMSSIKSSDYQKTEDSEASDEEPDMNDQYYDQNYDQYDNEDYDQYYDQQP